MLGEYHLQFHGGALGPEAAVLEVRALLGAGERPRAERLGEQVIARAPNSQHARIVRSLLGRSHNR
jgi:hypothetical protein